ncbi:MAG: hypothetical protein ACTSSF_01460 [Candidatus Heimdallarchaeaceae archaeon]
MNTPGNIFSELEDLQNLEDVEAVILFRADGNVIESIFSENNSQERLRTIQWSKANIEKVSLEMRSNNLQKVNYELNNFHVLFFIVNKIIILTIIANQDANLSLLSIESKRKTQILSSIL